MTWKQLTAVIMKAYIESTRSALILYEDKRLFKTWLAASYLMKA